MSHNEYTKKANSEDDPDEQAKWVKKQKKKCLNSCKAFFKRIL